MSKAIQTIKIDDIEYVRADSINNLEPAEKLDGKEYVLIRTNTAGVHVGYLDYKDGDEVKLLRCRRIWRWEGAASLSQLSVDGTSKPKQCKFPCEVPWDIFNGVIETMPVSKKAKKSIEEVSIWAE